jgi:Zn-dependent protease
MRLLKLLMSLLCRRPAPTRLDLHFRAIDFPVRVHPTFWLSHAFFAAGVATADLLRGDPWWPLAFVLCLVGTTASVLAHELEHALAGRRVGMYCEIVLVGFGGSAYMTYYGYILNMGSRPSRRQRVFLHLGGPAVNLAIAAAALTAWGPLGSTGEIYREIVKDPPVIPQSLVGCSLLEYLVLVLAGVNLAAGAGNLVPIPPLDGGWITLEVIGWVRTPRRPNWDVPDPDWGRG